MQAQTNVFPVQTQAVGQTQVVGQTQAVGQTQVVPVQTITTSQERNTASREGILEIIFHVLCRDIQLKLHF